MTRRVASMNLAQQHALTSAGPDGRLTVTDRRVIGGLIRRGWVQAVDERVRRRTVTRYMITERGRDALNTVPVVQPRPRPMWRDHWDVTPVVVGWCYVVVVQQLLHQLDVVAHYFGAVEVAGVYCSHQCWCVAEFSA
ncbi:hypothetical protein ACFQ1S_21140, partial [Kibdelosporangium lantanae]